MRSLVVCVTAASAMCAGCKDSAKTGEAPSPGSAIAPGPPIASVARDAATTAPVHTPTSEEQQAKLSAVLPVIRKIASDSTIVTAVQDQNAKKIPLVAIQKLDKEWIASTGVTSQMKPYLENPCAEALKHRVQDMPAVVEAFAMDNLGGLVCTIFKTSDYWQGDEAKWQKSFADGKGAEFIDKPSFDDSSQSYTVQISLPVMEKDHAIGAITIGLALDKL